MPRPSRLFPILLSLAFTTTLLAQIPDLRVSLEAPTAPVPGQTYLLRGTVSNAGNGTANDVIFRFDVQTYRVCPELSIARLEPGESRTVDCSVTLPATDLPNYSLGISLSATTQGGQLDTNFLDNSLFRTIRILSPPDLYVSFFPGIAIPGLPFRADVIYGNRAHTSATGTVVTIESPARILHAPDTCTVTGNRAVCNVGRVEDMVSDASTGRLVLSLEAPDISGHTFPVTVSIDANEPDAGPANDRLVTQVTTYRTFMVTTNADSGSGSFRAAIEAANAIDDGQVSLVAFRIPPGGQAWQTIRLESPLPKVVAGSIWFDGTTQTGFFGNTNPAGPEIELTGIGLAQKYPLGHGIDAGTACGINVTGLAINGFPGNGINATDPNTCSLGYPRVVRDSYIGTDPTGTRTVPNSRGIYIGHNEGPISSWTIERNVISGNARAGVFIVRGKHLVRDNKIGLNATATAALGNGASGVYLGTHASGTDVENNFIGFNQHFGIALDRDTQYVSMRGNRFLANANMAIDWGLDNLASVGPIPVPEITSVRVENGHTIIEGTHAANSTFPPYINLYANDVPDPSGYGEGQYLLGEIRPAEPGKFTYTFPTDLRGKWVTATATQVYYTGWAITPPVQSQSEYQGFYITTSEFSRAVEVR